MRRTRIDDGKVDENYDVKPGSFWKQTIVQHQVGF